MSRTVLRMGQESLWQVARPVLPDEMSSIRELVDDMEATMEAYEGTGLAAPQIGIGLRVVIFEVRSVESEADVPRTVLINPEIEVVDATLEPGWEGCLSVPGMRGVVERHREIIYRGIDVMGNTIERNAANFHARVVQHEVDHLDGILYPMRISDMRLFGFTQEMSGEA